MKKILACITLLFIVSCGKQTAPALELQDTDAVQVSSEVDRAELPNPQEATFAAESADSDGDGVGDNADAFPEDAKKEIKVEPEVLFPD
ncbi:MAG: hypothetical protein DSY99_03415, partial [Candidatus Neomarinimicrobiota bacterium]